MDPALWQGRPSAVRYFFTLRSLGFVMLIAVFVGSLIAMSHAALSPETRHLLQIAIACVAGMGAVMMADAFVAYRSIRFNIRAHGVEFSRGVLMRDHKTLLWAQLRSVELQRSLMDRMLGTGTICFSMGEQRNVSMDKEVDTLSSISDAERVYQVIQSAMSKSIPHR